MPRSTNANLREKIDEIRAIIQNRGSLPTNLAEFLDTQPFCKMASLVKIGDQIKIRTNDGDLDITFDELIGNDGRIGIGMVFLSMLENRLPIFYEILNEVAMDPTEDKANVREEVIRERREQELKEIADWNGPSREIAGFTWTKAIGGRTFLTIAYFRDRITEEYVTRGLIVPFPPKPQWLIKEGRKYEWLLRPDDHQRLFSEGFVDTDFGIGEVINEDVSTPEKMAIYLENLADIS